MSSIQRKLTSKTGISMAMALVFFLLCAMVGTVVLSAASVAAGTVRREQALSQRTMSLNSAAGLLAKEISPMTMTQECTKTETVTTTVTTTTNADGETESSTTVSEDKSDSSGAPVLTGPAFLQGITIMVPAAPPNPSEPPKLNAQPPAPLNITIGPSDGDYGEKIPEVTGTLSFAEDFTLTVRLNCGSDNAVTMVFPAHTQMESDVHVDTLQPNETQSVKTTTTTYKFTVTWEAPEITEGAPTEEGGTAP